MALIKCLECGKEISNKAETCPHCGCPVSELASVNSLLSESVVNSTTTEKKPKKKIKTWLLISAIVLVIAIVAIVIIFLPSKYKWNEVLLNSTLPEPSSQYGDLYINRADDLSLRVEKVSFSEYQSYLNECIDKGFTYVVKSSASSYKAFNSDGYELKLDYYEYDKVMSISLTVRITGTIKWSNSDIASLLPVPTSNVGSVVSDYNYGYNLYVGNTSKFEYDEYIAECEEKGFRLNIQKTDATFYAENELGYELVVEYYECNLIHIDLDVPEDDVSNEEDSANEETTVNKQETTTTVPSSPESTSSNKDVEENDTYILNGSFTYTPRDFMNRFSEYELDGANFLWARKDEEKLYYEIAEVENEYRNVGIVGFDDVNGDALTTDDDFANNVIARIIVLIDDANDVPPILVSCMCATDPMLNVSSAFNIAQDIVENAGTKTGYTHNNIKYVIAVDGDYYYIIITPAAK